MLSKSSTYLSFIVLSIISLSVLTATAQSLPPKDEVHIRIQAVEIEPMPTQYYIDIVKSANSVKLVYALYDSLRQTDLRKDTTYQRLDAVDKSSKETSTSQERIKIWNALTPIYAKYKVYQKDSVTFSADKDTAYVNLINKVVAAPDEQLQDPKDRGVVDGISLSFEITSTRRRRKVQTSSPTPMVNPLLYQLLTQTLNQYRKVKGEAFLSKRKAGGY